MRIRVRRAAAALSAVVVALAPFVSHPLLAQDSLRAGVRKRSMAEDMQLFGQVLNQLRVNHVDSLDPHDLLMAAIDGMVAAADPHSFVIPVTRLDSTRTAAMRDGKLVPIPITFDFVGGAPLVASVAPGSRAVALDILPGDELVTADGHPIAATSDDELQVALSGPKNTTAALVFRRRRSDATVVRFERAVVREKVDEQTAVPAAVMLANYTGYVRVTTFMGDKVADDLHDALNKLEHGGMQRLVLDLRANGGGRVDEAKRIAGEFLPSGAIVYTAAGRKKEVTDTGRVSHGFWSAGQRKYPIVLLVDAGTASASELVAGALQDHDRALVVGHTTFGKSLLMRAFPLSDGSMMELVVGELSTPCGRVIQREYHGEARRDYYLDAGQPGEGAAGAAGTKRPSCVTDNGRTEYGGGGIVPDVILPRATPAPTWLNLVRELSLTTTWAAGYVTGNTAPSLATVDALAASPTLTPDALANFRAYAAKSSVNVPEDSASSAMLSRTLVRAIAFAKFGTAGYYRLVALTDPEVEEAIGAFDKAGQLLGGR